MNLPLCPYAFKTSVMAPEKTIETISSASATILLVILPLFVLFVRS